MPQSATTAARDFHIRLLAGLGELRQRVVENEEDLVLTAEARDRTRRRQFLWTDPTAQ